MKADTVRIYYAATPSHFGKVKIPLGQRHDQAPLSAYLKEQAEDLEQMLLIYGKQHKIVYLCLEVVFQFFEALFDLLLKVGSRVATALCGPRRHYDAFRSAKGEEWLAFGVKRCLPVTTAEIDSGEGLGTASVG